MCVTILLNEPYWKNASQMKKSELIADTGKRYRQYQEAKKGNMTGLKRGTQPTMNHILDQHAKNGRWLDLWTWSSKEASKINF
jgi:hypothetical protein